MKKQTNNATDILQKCSRENYARNEYSKIAICLKCIVKQNNELKSCFTLRKPNFDVSYNYYFSQKYNNDKFIAAQALFEPARVTRKMSLKSEAWLITINGLNRLSNIEIINRKQ